MGDYVPLIYFGSELVAVGDLWIQKDWEAGIKSQFRLVDYKNLIESIGSF